MKLISQTEYAKRRGCSQPYIAKLVRQGRIPTVNGKIDPAAADAAIAASSDPSKGKNGTSAMDTPERVETPLERNDASPALGKVKIGYAQARLQREVYQAFLKKLEYEKLKAKLLDSDEVLKAWASACINIRAALDKIPAKCCAKCRTVVDDAIGAALKNLSEGAVIGDDE